MLKSFSFSDILCTLGCNNGYQNDKESDANLLSSNSLCIVDYMVVNFGGRILLILLHGLNVHFVLYHIM